MAEKKKVLLKMEELTLGDLEDFESVTGNDLMETLKPVPVIDPETKRPVPDPDDPKGRPLMQARVTAKALLGMVFLALRKEDETLTYADVRALRMDDLDFDVEETVADSDDTNPTSEPGGDDESSDTTPGSN